MPGMSGMEVMQQITTNWPETCVIMVTGVDDTQTAVEVMKLGAYDYITKPFKRDDVAQKVQEAVGKWRHQLQEKRQLLQRKKSVGE